MVKRSATPAEAFQAFTESFQQLTNLEEEYKAYRLDEALVAAIVPVVSSSHLARNSLRKEGASNCPSCFADANGLEELGCA